MITHTVLRQLPQRPAAIIELPTQKASEVRQAVEMIIEEENSSEHNEWAQSTRSQDTYVAASRDQRQSKFQMSLRLEETYHNGSPHEINRNTYRLIRDK